MAGARAARDRDPGHPESDVRPEERGREPGGQVRDLDDGDRRPEIANQTQDPDHDRVRLIRPKSPGTSSWARIAVTASCRNCRPTGTDETQPTAEPIAGPPMGDWLTAAC